MIKQIDLNELEAIIIEIEGMTGNIEDWRNSFIGSIYRVSEIVDLQSVSGEGYVEELISGDRANIDRTINHLHEFSRFLRHYYDVIQGLIPPSKPMPTLAELLRNQAEDCDETKRKAK